MVISEQLPCNGNRGTLCLRLLPNRSATWLQTMYVVAAIAVLSMAVAIFWAVQGAWVILPFTLLELMLLAYVAHRVSSATYYQQVILIGDDTLEVQWGKTSPARTWVFAREQAQLEIIKPHHSLSPPQVILAAGERSLPIGAQLNRDDINLVINHFKQARVPYKVSGHTVVNAIDGFDL